MRFHAGILPLDGKKERRRSASRNSPIGPHLSGARERERSSGEIDWRCAMKNNNDSLIHFKNEICIIVFGDTRKEIY